MNIEGIDKGTTFLVPKDAGALRIGPTPGTDGGIGVVIRVDTANLGNFTIPISKWQLGTIVAVANVLLKLTEQQVTELRAQLVREQQEKDQEND